jgi:hypothetical protein
MSQKELSMLLYRSILFLRVILLLVLLSSCTNNIFADKDIYNTIFVDDISERRGLVIRNTLLEYFPNRDYESTDYIIKVETKKNNEYYLTASSGFASRNRVSITANWSVIYKPTGKVLLKISNNYIESYNIETVGQSNIINEKISEDSLSRTIAQDIALKTFSLMLRIKKNPYLLGTKINDNQALYELFDTFDAFEYDIKLDQKVDQKLPNNSNNTATRNLIIDDGTID